MEDTSTFAFTVLDQRKLKTEAEDALKAREKRCEEKTKKEEEKAEKKTLARENGANKPRKRDFLGR